MKHGDLVNNKRRILVFEIVGLAFILLMLGFMFYTSVLCREEEIPLYEECHELSQRWALITEDGKTEDVELPCKHKAAPSTKVILEKRLPAYITADDYLSLRTINQNVNVYIDDELRYSFSQPDTLIKWANPVSRYLYVNISDADCNKIIRIEFIKNVGATRNFSRVYIGEKNSLIANYMRIQKSAIVFAVIFFLLGLICIVVGLSLRIATNGLIRVDYIGVAMFLAALWNTTKSDFRDMVFSNISNLHVIPLLCLMLLTIPLALYYNWLQKMRYTRFYQIVIAISLAHFVIWFLLVALGITNYENSLFSTGAILLLQGGGLVVTVIKDAKKKLLKDYLPVLAGLLLFVTSGFGQLAIKMMPEIGEEGTILCMGFALFTLTAYYHAIRMAVRLNSEKKAAYLAADVKSQFLATMSHEIRTPINAVLGMNEAILRESTEENILGYANDVDTAGKLLLSLINDILDFTKLESGKMTLVPTAYKLKGLVTFCVNMVNNRAKEKGLNLIVTVDKDTPSVYFGDETRIQQIITNLLTNAVKYTKRGEVELKVSCEKKSEDDGDLIISVRDTGRGIKEENREWLFKPFVRVEEHRNTKIEGTGLGLAITHKFVELMNGSIEVDSTFGKGSTFTVRLPQQIISWEPVGEISSTENKEHEERRKEENHFKAPGVKMLVVDDVQLNLKVVNSLLKKSEMEIDNATGGEECLEKTKTKKYDIILLDHMMPGKDGIQTLWDLRKDKENLNIDTPVVMMTANALNGAKEEYMGIGFSDYISKPFNLSDLQAVILKNLPKEEND